MKIFWVGNAYPESLEKFFSETEDMGQSHLSYQNLKEKIDASYVNYFATGWCRALQNIGYETENVVMDAIPLQQLWLKENGIYGENLSSEEILLLQIKKYCPTIVFADDCCSAELLRCIRSEVSSIKLIVGWSGSALAKDPAKKDMFKMLDIVLCCAPESVAFLQKEGAKAVHMNHAFPVEVQALLKKSGIKHSSMLFVGSIIRGKEFHLFREKLLLGLLDELPLDIYSPSISITKKRLLRAALEIGLYDITSLFPNWVAEKILSPLPYIGRICGRKERPVFPINFDLYRQLLPPIFGLEMFDVLSNSDIVLNIHADSSPEFASNARLYEGTGVGSCLLTDSRKNMKDLFMPGKEVVTYESLHDCVEKAKWLIQHPAERKEIAEAGKRRCLKDHTYHNRAAEFDRIIRRTDQYKG